MANEDLECIKTATEAIGGLIEAAGDSPKVKEAGDQLGQTALTVTKAINNCLLPIAAVNYGFDKARKYFSERFSEDVAEKTKDIPPENLQEPNASIAGPTLQALAFAHEEDALREMYLELLKTSMDNRTSSEAHPAFVEIIKQLSTEDALAIKSLLSYGNVAVAELRLKNHANGGWTLLYTNLLSYIDDETEEQVENPRMPSMVSNLSRLGLIKVSYENYITKENMYDWVQSRPEYLNAQKAHPNRNVEIKKGYICATPLGLQFGKVIGVLHW